MAWLAAAAAAAALRRSPPAGRRPAAASRGSGTAQRDGTTATMWLVTTGPSPANTADAESGQSRISRRATRATTSPIDFVENQSYKQKIQLAMGAGNPPTIFWTWGGGPSSSTSRRVTSVAGPTRAGRRAFLPSSLGAVTYNGQLYGVPVEGTQPVYFFYNKPIFAKYHLTFPTTLSGLLSTVATLKSHGIAPISLANGDQWPGLMYLEYLTDRDRRARRGRGPAGQDAGGWSNPAVTKALERHPAAGQGGRVPERLRLAALQRRRLRRPGLQRQGRHAAHGRLGHLQHPGVGQVLRDRRQPGHGPVPDGRRGPAATRPTWPATPPATSPSPATPPPRRRPSPRRSSGTS